ncbi:MAG: helix-turn-helix domain-containing protein, partial [Oscillospiraceae bacterium]|nr:helix-turn-helix domain-containing protein [Oscillospiraceae bacterium]
MIADRIKALRDGSGMTQTALGKALGISRAAVNAWEMGISVPS